MFQSWLLFECCYRYNRPLSVSRYFHAFYTPLLAGLVSARLALL